MKSLLREFFGRFPVPVLRGPARGAWWSIYPHSAYWRLGGNDPVVETIFARYARRRHAVVWDIGAHYGIYAVGAARMIDPGGCVEAFEPDPVSFQRLLWHRRLNGLTNLHVHNVAASAQTGHERLYHYEGLGTTTTHLPYPNESTAGVAFVEVATVALDEWVDAGRIRRPSFVKIDVEGHAGAVLAGMRRTLAANRPTLLLAVHDENERTTIERVFADLRYSLTPAAPDWVPELTNPHYGEFLAEPLTTAGPS